MERVEAWEPAGLAGPLRVARGVPARKIVKDSASFVVMAPASTLQTTSTTVALVAKFVRAPSPTATVALATRRPALATHAKRSQVAAAPSVVGKISSAAR